MAKSKRLRKKQQKQKLISKYPEKKKASYAELQAYDAEQTRKAKHAAEQRAYVERRHTKLKEKAREIGYTGDIPKSWNMSKLLAAAEKEAAARERAKREARNSKRRARIESKYTYLLENGVEQKAARRLANKDISKQSLDDYIYGENKIYYTGGAALGVSWADTTGESDLRGAFEECKSMTLQEEINKINERYSECEFDQDDSGGFKGVAIVCIGEDMDDCKAQMHRAKLRGYKDKVNYNYAKLSASNTFTLKGYADILYTAMMNTGNANAKRVYDQMSDYAYTYLPEIYERIFNQ